MDINTKNIYIMEERNEDGEKIKREIMKRKSERMKQKRKKTI